MTVSLILPVYNAPEDLRVCLDSLAPGLERGEYDLTLINDASGEEATQILRDYVQAHRDAPPPSFEPRLVEHGANQGYLRTVNEGLHLVKGDIVVLLNSDTALPPGFAARVEACFAADARIGLASPISSHCGLFSIPMKPGWTGRDVARMDDFFRPLPPLYPTVILPDGFCLCLRRKMLDQIGLFDERYDPGYFEETDLGMRARKQGWKTVLIDNTYVYHKSHASFGEERTREYMLRNQDLFSREWGEEFGNLRKRYPPWEHRVRLYRIAYSPYERVTRKILRFLAQFIPVRESRRRIRSAYK